MTPSKYQIAIFETIKTLRPSENLVIQARAGSGKTSTIVKALEMLPTHERILFLAFNKSIADELKTRVPSNVEASTLNSFGWRVCLKNTLSAPKLDQYKVPNMIRSLVPPNEVKKITGCVKQLVSLMKAWNFSPDCAVANVELLSQKYSVEIPDTKENVFHLAITVFNMSLQDENIMDFDDQIFFPIAKDYGFPKYDKVFVDEAQDLNHVQIEMVKRLAVGGSVVAVGDDKQAIYGFRGADPDALDNLIEELEATVLPLSVCYRCSKSVIAKAQQIVPDIESHENAPQGKVERMSVENMRKMWENKHFVLCRVTAPLVQECLRMIRERRKATVKGRDIGQNLLDLLNKIERNYNIPIPDGVVAYCQDETRKLAKFPNSDDRIAMLQDKCDTLTAILESTKTQTAGEAAVMIETIFSDTANSGTIFSTVHKSKGLEAENVFILSPELMPHPAAKTEWQKKQEKNLMYVAWTRAKENLFIQA